MSKTKKYRKDHDQLLKISKEISPLLIEERISRDPEAVRGGLSKLAAKLRVHLLLEDKPLYPILQNHSDEKVAVAGKTHWRVSKTFSEVNK